MNLIKTLRTVIAGGVGLGLSIGAACVVQEAPRAPQQQYPAATAPTAPTGQPAAGQLADGWYYCHFRQNNTDYQRYFCRIYHTGPVQRIQKVGGFELFGGTLAATAAGTSLDGRSNCNKMGTNCRGSFNVSFAGTSGMFQGTVQKPGWWLHNATLTLQYISPQAPHGSGYSSTRYGGVRYGGAHYGGARYGGARYGGARYGGHRYGGHRYGGHR